MNNRFRKICLPALLPPFISNAWAANLVTNPDFDNGLTGWSNLGGSISVHTQDGDPTAPSLQVAAGALNSISIASSDCIAVSPGTTYSISTNTNANVGRAALDLAFYSSNLCGDAESLGSTSTEAAVPTNGWVHLALPNDTVPNGTLGVRVNLIDQLHASGNVYPALFDHVDFEVLSTPVRLQSFDVD